MSNLAEISIKKCVKIKFVMRKMWIKEIYCKISWKFTKNWVGKKFSIQKSEKKENLQKSFSICSVFGKCCFSFHLLNIKKIIK